MLKTYQFKTQCKGDSSKTANIILPALMTDRSTPLRVQNRIQVQCIQGRQ